MMPAKITRTTSETSVEISLVIEGSGKSKLDVPIGFLRHMLETFSLFGAFDIGVKATGDMDVDQHHIVEDCGIALGQAFREALGNKQGINRAGYFAFPMDESLALVAVDISGRPYLNFGVKFRRPKIGDLEADTIQEFFQGFTRGLQATLHATMPYGENDHHKCEALFKAFGKALYMACSRDKKLLNGIPSTKGVIE
ncbi:MAG: imidazoleglycerol-phosphate dehydratase HisB [Candidatus Aenigmarchaeota archaeon]|nr:imidazoleglycerol-phosphate dehydratase HisB [Candidatus Aenigmarchaeota archaeon]